MPRKNVVKLSLPDSYYHIYARGNNKQQIFIDKYDYSVFFNLLKRYLSLEPAKDDVGRPYPHLRGKIELLAYCLMPNHFHLLVYQIDETAMPKIMRGVMTSYSTFFNKKYKRSGSVFDSSYKASLIDSDQYLAHISRYIHLNPSQWQSYAFSSFKAYMSENQPDWLQPDKVLSNFNSKVEYRKFLEDYEGHKNQLDAVKQLLAGS